MLMDALFFAEVEAFRDWVREDEKIAGLWGWHYGDEPVAESLHVAYTIGTRRFAEDRGDTARAGEGGQAT